MEKKTLFISCQNLNSYEEKAINESHILEKKNF